MDKPKRPKKPSAFREKEPSREVTEIFYPREKYHHDSLSSDRVYLMSEEIPGLEEDGDWSEETQFWHDDHPAINTISLQDLLDFANEKGVSPNKIQVTSIVPHDTDYTELELRVTRQLTDEEYQIRSEDYNQKKAAWEETMANYEAQKAAYPRLKAEYELFIAQQRLAELES